MSEEQFSELLQEELIPETAIRFGGNPVSVFDNSWSGIASSINQPTGTLFKKEKWPPKSSHLSPFKTIWSLIEQSIRLQRRQPQIADELWDYVNTMWKKRTGQPLF